MKQVDKPIQREVLLAIDNRPPHPHVVTWYPHGVMGVREKGKRKETKFSIEDAWVHAVYSDALKKGGK